MRRKFGPATEPHTSRLRTISALASPRKDEMTLELRKAAKDSQHQSAMSPSRIAPRIA
jgi:hypothetical protein